MRGRSGSGPEGGRGLGKGARRGSGGHGPAAGPSARSGAPTAGKAPGSAAKAPPPRRWTAIAHPGLERVVAAELAEAGFQPEPGAGEVCFTADPAAVVAALPALRTPDRLLLEVVRGRAYTLDELAALVRRADWRTLLLPDAALEVSLTLARSRLHFKDSTEKKIAWAISEARKGPRLVDGAPRPKEAQRVQARIVEDDVTISLDAGGLLHRRGWKQDVAKAPLRENLAAALLRLSGWSPELPLLDPFCGSGTLVIEAALAAAGRSPFVGRSFACAEWPFVSGKSTRPGGPRPARPADPAALTRAWLAGRAATPTLIGSDRDPQAITAAMENARRAKVEIRFQRLDVGDLEPIAPTGFIVTNPPWGIRLADGARGPDAGSIYSRFGAVIRERFDDWTVLFLAPEASLATRVGRDVRRVADFTSGGVHIGVWRKN